MDDHEGKYVNNDLPLLWPISGEQIKWKNN